MDPPPAPRPGPVPGPWSRAVRQPHRGLPGDPALVREREELAELLERDPGDVDRLVVRVTLDRQRATRGVEEVVVHVLVDPAALDREPVVDGAEEGDDVAPDAGLLLDLADGGLLGRL